jgi:opacity protein-like surface antigen
MKSFNRFLLGAATGALMASPALAADYSPPIFVEKMPEYVSVEVGTGWYLRGDVSYNMNRPTYRSDLFDVDHWRIGGSVGFGYQLNDFLRAETSLAYIGRDRRETDDNDDPVSWNHSLWTGMASGFVDLGTVVGITPYVGAGVGLAHSRDQILGEGDAERQYRFAYTLNAGAAYRMTDNVSLDVGYQFLSSPRMRYRDIDTDTERRGIKHHQLRVGLRYALW